MIFLKAMLSLALQCAAAAVLAASATPAVAATKDDSVARLNNAACQARSVHLVYCPKSPDVESAMATVSVTEAQTNTFYMTLGWDCGYCGIQDFFGRRIFIFSVWESEDNDLHADESRVPDAVRAKALYTAPGASAERFGHEGTGMSVKCALDWKVGVPVSVRVDSAPEGDERIMYTASVKTDGGDWRKVATLSTIYPRGKKRVLNYLHSFVEDFWRNGESARRSRSAVFRDVKTRQTGSGEWTDVREAVFSADATKTDNIDAGPTGDGGCFLKTGGATVNEHQKLWSRFAF